MSSLDELHEVMSAALDIPRDYDTDTISVNDTESSNESDYPVNCIIAEAPGPDLHYLVSWQDYPLHRCTWEPPASLDDTDLIVKWDEIKQELSKDAFDRLNAKNIETHDKAREEANAARDRRLAKREKKRRRLKRRNRRLIANDDNSSDEELSTPLSSKDSMFVAEKAPAPQLPVTAPSRTYRNHIVRKAPLQQSSSEEGSNSDDSLMGNPRRRLGHHTTSEKSRQTSMATDKPRVGPPRVAGTASQTKSTRAINFVNEPKEKQQRRNRPETQHYNELRYRALAEKKSHTENAPDFSALTFVNGQPPSLPKSAPPREDDNPYGRREITHRRVQNDEPEDRPRPGPTNVSVPLADWEVSKVPLMCYQWKFDLSCHFGAKDCKFMHRESDSQGQPYPIGRYDGYVEPKYRIPSIACLYMLRGQCRKTAEECEYSHEDTGWTFYNNVPIEIKHLPPGYAAPGARDDSLIPYKEQDPPITCPHWLWNLKFCSKPQNQCKYAHWNTGWVPPESDFKALPIQVDSKLKPRFELPKYADPAVTCPFWLRSYAGCTRTDADCRYAHKNTGWAPPALSTGKPLQINPKQKPRSQTVDLEASLTRLDLLPSKERGGASQVSDQTVPSGQQEQDGPRPTGFSSDRIAPKNSNPPLTCHFWLNGPQGCMKLADHCMFAHKNTGWINKQGSNQSEQIDPNKQPRCRKHGKCSKRLGSAQVLLSLLE